MDADADAWVFVRCAMFRRQFWLLLFLRVSAVFLLDNVEAATRRGTDDLHDGRVVPLLRRTARLRQRALSLQHAASATHSQSPSARHTRSSPSTWGMIIVFVVHDLLA
jgi:hypothetical protein